MEGEKERKREGQRGKEDEGRWKRKKKQKNKEDKRKTERRGKCSKRVLDRYIYRNKVKGSKDLIQLFYLNDSFFRLTCRVVFAISISLIIS